MAACLNVCVILVTMAQTSPAPRRPSPIPLTADNYSKQIYTRCMPPLAAAAAVVTGGKTSDENRQQQQQQLRAV